MKAKDLIKMLEQNPEAVLGVWHYTGSDYGLYEPDESTFRYVPPDERTAEHDGNVGEVTDGVFEIGYP